MNEPCTRITLDVQQPSTPAFVAVKHGDTGRKIIISLSNGGFPYEITSDCYAVLTGTKPDGNILYNHCEIDGNTIVYEITEQTTAAAGRMKAEVKLYGADDTLVTSAMFRIIVDGTIYNDSEVESSAEYSALTHLISQATELIKKEESEGGTVDEETVKRIVEEYLEENPLGGGADPAEIQRLVSDYLKENPPQVAETDPTVPDWAKQAQKPTYTAKEVGALPDTYTPPNQTAAQVGADPSGTAAAAVAGHNTDTASHNDLRAELKALADRVNAALDSDDTTLDELSEIVVYIKSNKTLIDAITTSKVSVADIVNDLTTNVANKPLSAAQGVVLKGLIEEVRGLVPSELPNPNALTFTGAVEGSYDGSEALSVEIPGGGWKAGELIGEIEFTEGSIGTAYWEFDCKDISEIYVYAENLVSQQTMGFSIKINDVYVIQNLSYRKTEGEQRTHVWLKEFCGVWLACYTQYDFAAMGRGNLGGPLGTLPFGLGRANKITIKQSTIEEYQAYSGKIQIYGR